MIKNFNNKIKKYDLKWWFFGTLILTILMETAQRWSISGFFSFMYMNPFVTLLTYFILLSITSVSFLFKKKKAVYTFISGIMLMTCITSGMMFKMRGTPLIWADIYSIKDGMSIAKNYISTTNAIEILVAILAFAFLITFIGKKEKVDKQFKIVNFRAVFIIIPTLICTFLLLAYNNSANNITIYRWDLPETYSKNGFVVSFLSTEQGFKMKAPESYADQSIKDIKLAASKMESDSKKEEVKPNIIVMQIESFFDPKRLKNVTFEEDPIPNFRKLYNSNSHGMLNVPTFGGGTVRSEFEVLTGLSTDYIPVGEIPNNNILKRQPVESMAYILKDKGYDANVVHNYLGNFYDRDKVFANLGFDYYVPLEYMDNLEKEGKNFPKDTLNLPVMEKILGERKEPQFIYNITVETHGGYDKKYKAPKYTVSGDITEEERNQIQEYIDKLKGVDEYIGKLINYVEKSKEPTIIAMFSDHLPALDVISKEGTQNFDVNEKYSSEYLIWDNIGLKKENKNMEAYQFSTYILNLIGVNSGLMPNFHNAYSNEADYQEKFEDLEYDILFGDKYIYDDGNPYEKTDLKIGLEDIVIEKYYEEDGKFIIKGKNFNSSSKVMVNGSISDSELIDENTLVLKKVPKKVQEIKVVQVGRYSKVLGESNILK